MVAHLLLVPVKRVAPVEVVVFREEGGRLAVHAHGRRGERFITGGIVLGGVRIELLDAFFVAIGIGDFEEESIDVAGVVGNRAPFHVPCAVGCGEGVDQIAAGVAEFRDDALGVDDLEEPVRRWCI